MHIYIGPKPRLLLLSARKYPTEVSKVALTQNSVLMLAFLPIPDSISMKMQNKVSVLVN